MEKTWSRNNLPLNKYTTDEKTVDLKLLVDDIIENLPKKHFSDYCEYEDTVGFALNKIWDNWMSYFEPRGELFAFQRAIRNGIRQETEISFDK